MNNSDEVLSALQGEAEMLVWMLERMGHSKACELCGTPTAPSDLIESRVRTRHRLEWALPLVRSAMASAASLSR